METGGAGIVDGLDHRIVVITDSGVVHRPEVVPIVTGMPRCAISVESLGMLDTIRDGHIIAAVLVEEPSFTVCTPGIASLRPNW